MGVYLIPAREVETEITVVNSRFIATLGPVFSAEEAREFIARVHRRFPDATHHVPAFLIGFGSSVITHCSDDGEPSGTSGRPVLNVIQGSGMGDIVAVITRYFGGTKLGTGGLVRAYSDATKAGLSILPKARKIATHTVLVALHYTFLERARLISRKNQAIIQDESFAADVTLSVQLPIESFETFRLDLVELTAGKVQVEIIETNPATILPVHE
ncbi:MAG: YigZ family protein [Anaerolineae bacterium]|nr:YigZ family protein [Anaerolineae bacterium]